MADRNQFPKRREISTHLQNFMHIVDSFLETNPEFERYFETLPYEETDGASFQTIFLRDIKNTVFLASSYAIESELPFEFYHDICRQIGEIEGLEVNRQESHEELIARVKEFQAKKEAHSGPVTIAQFILQKYASQSADPEEAFARVEALLDKYDDLLQEIQHINGSEAAIANQMQIAKLREEVQLMFQQAADDAGLSDDTPNDTGHDMRDIAVIEDDATPEDVPKNARQRTNHKRDEDFVKLINNYGTDMTEEAFNDVYPSIHMREESIEKLQVAISRRKSPQVAIIGEKGVGKSGITQGFAQRIVDGDVPERLKETEIIDIDLAKTSHLTGSGTAKDPITDSNMTVDLFKQNVANILRFIHDENQKGFITIARIDGGFLVGDFGGDATAARNIIKSELKRSGPLPIILEMNKAQFAKLQKKDPELAERFSTVDIGPLSKQGTASLLREQAEDYSDEYNVKISDKILNRLLELSNKHMASVKQPGWALSLLDGSVSRAEASGEYVLREHHIVAEIAEQVKLPTEFIGKETSERIRSLREELPKRIFGQDKAVDAVCSTLQGIKLRDKNKPLGVLYLKGPTGVGKTELSLQLANILFEAEEMFGEDEAVIKVDMTNFSDRVSVSKIVGASPNYVGYNDPTVFESVRERPYSVVVLDEIDKADPAVLKALMPVFDTGMLPLNNGQVIDFRNTLVIMTSNLGAEVAAKARNQQSIGFSEKDDSEERAIEAQNKEIEDRMAPEVRNRMTFIDLEPLGDKPAQKICRAKFKKVSDRLREDYPNVELYIEKRAFDEIFKDYDKAMGGRSIDRAVNEKLRQPLGRWMLDPENARALDQAPPGTVLRIRALKHDFNPVIEKPAMQALPAPDGTQADTLDHTP